MTEEEIEGLAHRLETDYLIAPTRFILNDIAKALALLLRRYHAPVKEPSHGE